MATVYVINRAAHDFSNAEKFGQLVYLSDSPINRYATNKMYRKFWKILRSSSSDDYILVTSLTVMNIIACGIFALLHGRLNLLIHKTDNNSYIERRLDLTDVVE
jgi:hypothetical protein